MLKPSFNDVQSESLTSSLRVAEKSPGRVRFYNTTSGLHKQVHLDVASLSGAYTEVAQQGSNTTHIDAS
jgi:hypothetical protein